MFSYLHNKKIITAFLLGAFLVGLLWYGSRTYLNNGLVHDSTDSSSNIFQVASSTGDNYFTITADGKVGVYTQVPTTALDVYGMIRTYSTTATECTTSIEGAIQYDAYNKHFLGCNGVEWLRLDQ